MNRNESLDLYDLLITATGAERKGATMPYTSINGHMFSYFTKDDFLALRLPEPERSLFLGRYQTELVKQYGIVQKEYVVVPEFLLENLAELQPFFKSSIRYVNSLKPKKKK